MNRTKLSGSGTHSCGGAFLSNVVLGLRWATIGSMAIGLTACSFGNPSIVKGPTSTRPVYPTTGIEQAYNTGSIFQPNNPSAMQLIQEDWKPRRVGDTLKIDISESLTASSKLTTESSRKNDVATKGPGGAVTMSSLINNIVNADASASGSDSFTGKGKTDNSNTLKGKLAASVINVLPNGNLEVAGEKKVAFNGTLNTLRFSGVVNPKDIKTDRVVSSEDVVDARLEQVGVGMIADTSSRNWLQRILTDSMTIW